MKESIMKNNISGDRIDGGNWGFHSIPIPMVVAGNSINGINNIHIIHKELGDIHSNLISMVNGMIIIDNEHRMQRRHTIIME